VATLTRWGLVPHTYVLTTIGRKTGRPRSTPVTLVEKGDQRWLVAPYGPVSWVLTAVADPQGTGGGAGQ
jgi:deazaflavin-dependent oxidoreductase (nitroreductase family)